MSANVLIIIGMVGFFLGALLLFMFFVRRYKRTAKRFSGKSVKSPGIYSSFRNLLLIFLWIILSIMILFIGFFMRSYHSFTAEKPVAEVFIRPTDTPQMIVVDFIQYSADAPTPRQFPVSGDQWVLEGDILKWNPWLNFFGLETRFRFTRLRGRYVSTDDERKRPATIHSLVADEDHPFWSYMYRYGSRMPFVSSVYGNAVFQNNAIGKRFLISVTDSGFLTREMNPQGN